MTIFFFMPSDYFFKKALLKTTFLLMKCIICPKTRLWFSRLFYSALQMKVNRMLCLIFPIFLHLQSCHTVSSLIAQGRFRWSHISVVTPRKKHFSSFSLAPNSKRGRIKEAYQRMLDLCLWKNIKATLRTDSGKVVKQRTQVTEKFRCEKSRVERRRNLSAI